MGGLWVVSSRVLRRDCSGAAAECSHRTPSRSGVAGPARPPALAGSVRVQVALAVRINMRRLIASRISHKKLFLLSKCSVSHQGGLSVTPKKLPPTRRREPNTHN